MSDDLIVPEGFLQLHVETLERYPGFWLVGGFKQHELATATPFGRYMDYLEKSWEEARKGEQLEPNIWEMSWPTARNLSLRRVDLERTGLFDEQFRVVCEDQDLTHHARTAGIRFLYNANITCLHNEQVITLSAYCRSLIRKAHDTLRFCRKWPIHQEAALVRVNGFVSEADSPALMVKKLAKSVLSLRPVCAVLEGVVHFAEFCRFPDRLLWAMYHLMVSIYTFRGWRDALKTIPRDEGAVSIGSHSHI